MQRTYKNIFELIGNTPLIQLSDNYKDNSKLVNIFAKLEMYNPTGSIKDRIALYMLTQAEKRKEIKPGATIIEASSGNTGASIALVAKAKGYKCLITTPAKTSPEKINLMRAYGAEVRICPVNVQEGDTNHYITLAKNLTKQMPNTYFLDQYNNTDNMMAHYYTTGPEIWKQMKGEIDYFICCGSSGGTISGTARYLKEKNPKIRVIMPDPMGSIYYSYFKHGKYNQEDISFYHTEGVGKDFICKCMDFSLIDDIIQFTDQMAFEGCRQLATNHGILAGGSSGAVYSVALNFVKSLQKANIAIIFPDTGIKYLYKIFI